MEMTSRMRLPLDQERMQLVVKKVYEYRRWEKSEDGTRKQSETQSTNKDGVPMWEIVCVSLGNGPDRVKVVLSSKEAPKVEQGSPVRFEGFDAVVWHVKSGLGADFYANGIKAEGQHLAKAG